MPRRGKSISPATIRFALCCACVGVFVSVFEELAFAQTATFRAPETVVPAAVFTASQPFDEEVGRFPEEIIEPQTPPPTIAPPPRAVLATPIPTPPEQVFTQPAMGPAFRDTAMDFAPPMQGPYGSNPSACDECCDWLCSWLHCCDHWFVHSDPDDPQRAIGYGEPLAGTSWLNRPYWVSAFGGVLLTDSPLSTAPLSDDFIIGLSVGHDFDHYFGSQFRIAGGSYSIKGSPFGSADNIAFVDMSLLHYPWGDARWRPYHSIGLGFSQQHFLANDGIAYHDWLINIPLGIGLKYQHSPSCVFRFEITNNLSFGGTYGFMDNIAFVGGLEYHFGGPRRSYFPWSPSITLD